MLVFSVTQELNSKLLYRRILYFEESKMIKSYPRNKQWRPIGLWDVKDPTLSTQPAVRLSASRTSRTLLPRNIYFLMFPVLISVRGWVNPRAFCYKPEGREIETRCSNRKFSINTILPAALGPGVYSASDRNLFIFFYNSFISNQNYSDSIS
jgi:hypothetical protein